MTLNMAWPCYDLGLSLLTRLTQALTMAMNMARPMTLAFNPGFDESHCNSRIVVETKHKVLKEDESILSMLLLHQVMMLVHEEQYDASVKHDN